MFLCPQALRDAASSSFSSTRAFISISLPPVRKQLGGSGFVVLTSTKHDYAPTVTDTEILVYVGDDGKVIDIEILAWVHGIVDNMQ